MEPGYLGGHVPVGRSVDNVSVRIIDRGMAPVFRGDTGKLCVGSDRLALGYVNDPGLSGERFVVDPFSPDINARFCRTGDFARELPYGAIHIVGPFEHSTIRRLAVRMNDRMGC